MSLVSIIIPNYNNAQWLAKCIVSCLEQEGDFKKEIIIVDDHSTDQSWSLLKSFKDEFPDEVFIFKNPSKGGNQARHFGFSKSNGEYIQWLDSDDILLAGKINEQIGHFNTHNSIDIVYSDWRMDHYEGEVKIKEVSNISKEKRCFIESLALDEWLPNNTYLLKRKIAGKLHVKNAWNQDRKVAQDREYYMMAAILGARFSYRSGIFSVYNRWNKGSVSRIGYKKRLVLNLELDRKLINEIGKQSWIKARKKKRLVGILKTNSLKSSFYMPSIRLLQPITFNEIQWDCIHPKMKPLIPIIWLYQSIRFFSTADISSDLSEK